MLTERHVPQVLVTHLRHTPTPHPPMCLEPQQVSALGTGSHSTHCSADPSPGRPMASADRRASRTELRAGSPSGSLPPRRRAPPLPRPSCSHMCTLRAGGAARRRARLRPQHPDAPPPGFAPLSNHVFPFFSGTVLTHMT